MSGLHNKLWMRYMVVGSMYMVPLVASMTLGHQLRLDVDEKENLPTIGQKKRISLLKDDRFQSSVHYVYEPSRRSRERVEYRENDDVVAQDEKEHSKKILCDNDERLVVFVGETGLSLHCYRFLQKELSKKGFSSVAFDRPFVSDSGDMYTPRHAKNLTLELNEFLNNDYYDDVGHPESQRISFDSDIWFEPLEHDVVSKDKTIDYSNMYKVVCNSSEEETKTVVSKKNRKYILVGHGYGSMIARYYAYKYPESVESLVLVDPINEVFHVFDEEWLGRNENNRWKLSRYNGMSSMGLFEPLLRIKSFSQRAYVLDSLLNDKTNFDMNKQQQKDAWKFMHFNIRRENYWRGIYFETSQNIKSAHQLLNLTCPSFARSIMIGRTERNAIGEVKHALKAQATPENNDLPHIPMLVVESNCFEDTNRAHFKEIKEKYGEDVLRKFMCTWVNGYKEFKTIPEANHNNVLFNDKLVLSIDTFLSKTKQ